MVSFNLADMSRKKNQTGKKGYNIRRHQCFEQWLKRYMLACKHAHMYKYSINYKKTGF